MQSYLSNVPWNRTSVKPWIILFFAFLNILFLGATRRAIGSYVAKFHKDFPTITLTELNWIANSYSAFGYTTSGLSIAVILYFQRRFQVFQFIGAVFVLSSHLTSSYVPNPHWLFLSHTLLHGIGSSLILGTIGLIVIEYFDNNHKYHLLATSLMFAGSLSPIFFVPFYSYIIQKYTWRISLRILAGMYFVVNGSSAIFFMKSANLTEPNKKSQFNCDLKSVEKSQIPLLFLWFIDRVTTSAVTCGIMLNLTDFLHRTQSDLVSSANLTTLVAGGEGVSFFIGVITTAVTRDLLKNKLGYLLLVMSSIAGSSLIVLEFVKDTVAQQILCFLTGVSIGPSITFAMSAGDEMTRLPRHISYPFTLTGMGFGMILSPLLSAKIAEMFNYKWFFFVQGLVMYVKALCLLIILLLLAFYKKYLKDSRSRELYSTSEEIVIEDVSSDENTQLLLEKSKQ